jgi:Ca-activated chloride channel family protein
VVGPRYMPGMPVSHEGSGWAPDTTHVPDASRISPPPAVPGTRAGHDITLTVSLDAGTEVFDIASALHEVDTQVLGSGRARVTLRNLAEIPNRDVILRYRTATADIGDAFLVHEDERGRFFTLILQPPRRVEARQAVPKEMIFVIDRSGSMGGFPIEKAKETMRLAIEHMNPDDTFNLLSFSGGTGHCFEKPVPNTAENRAIALQYLADLHGSGGTEMMPAIHAALDGPADPRRIRIVAFMTDGYIGNDLEIVDAVRAQAGTARVFAFGIGNAVNRFLLDGMAHAGRGEVEYVTLNGQADAAAQRFQERIHSPVLTDITIDWEGLPVEDVYPKQIPDLFSSQPLMIHGRLAGPARGAVLVRGRGASGPFERRVRLQAAADAGVHPAVASLWARAAVDDLMNRDLTALQRGNFPDAIRAEIEHLGVEFHLMTQFTSFVAVEELTVTVGGAPRTVAVPVEMPEGVSYEGVFGSDKLVVMQGMVGGAMVPRSALRGQPAAVQEFAARDSRMDYLAEPRAALAPGAKLAEPLRDLAARVTKDGANGTLTVGTLRVVNYRVDVMIALRDVSKKTLEALRGLGFVQTGDSKAARILIGTIDVRQLLMLEALDTVVRVAPVA